MQFGGPNETAWHIFTHTCHIDNPTKNKTKFCLWNGNMDPISQELWPIKILISNNFMQIWSSDEVHMCYHLLSNCNNSLQVKLFTLFFDWITIITLNYIFILDLTPGFNGLSKDNCKTRQEKFKFWGLVRLVLEVFTVCMLAYPEWHRQQQKGYKQPGRAPPILKIYFLEIGDKMVENIFVEFGYCHRWRLCMQVKRLADSLFVLCKLAYFDSATTEQLLIISPWNFVPIKKTHVFMSYQNSGWIRVTILEINAVKTSHFIKEIYSRPPMFEPCSLTITSMRQPGLTAH